MQSSDHALVRRRYELTAARSPITLGRDAACTVEIRSATVAPRHARLELRGDSWYFIDEVRSTEEELRSGSRVRIGDTVLELVEYIIETHFEVRETDGLTKLLNRRALRDRLAGDMRTRPLAVIRVDVDNLRAINLERGYEAGDQVLRALGMRIREQLGSDDYAGRLSADDFLIVTTPEVVEARAAQLRSGFDPRISVGMAVLGERDRDADELVYRAELDLRAVRAACR